MGKSLGTAINTCPLIFTGSFITLLADARRRQQSLPLYDILGGFKDT